MMKRIVWLVGCLFYSLVLLASPAKLAIDDQLSMPFWPAKDEMAGGLLLISGKDSHCQHLFTSMAEILSKRGWSVAVMPQAIDKDKFDEQLSLLIAKLRQKSKRKVGLVWYGNDFHPLLAYFSSPQAKKVSGLILLSAYQYPQQAVEKSFQLRFPVLDMVAQFDYPRVLQALKERQALLSVDQYAQRKIPGAHHDYRYQETAISAAIDNWMTKLPKPKVGRVFN